MRKMATTCNNLLTPCVYLNHGGGPMPLLGNQPNVASFLKSYGKSVKPTAILGTYIIRVFC